MADDPDSGPVAGSNGSSGSSGNGAGGPARPVGFMDRLSQTFLKPPKPRAAAEAPAKEPERPLTDAEVRERVRLIDPLERKIGLGASVLAAVITLLAWVPYIANPKLTVAETAKPIRGHICPPAYHWEKFSGQFTCLGHFTYARQTPYIYLVIGLLFALAIFVTVRIGRRAPLAFTMLLTGFALEAITKSIIGIAFVFAGGWLVVRVMRVRKFGSPTARGPQGDGAGATSSRTPRGQGKGAPPAKARDRRSKKGAPAVDATGRTKPSPNKRYTPKAPPRKRVPPPE